MSPTLGSTTVGATGGTVDPTRIQLRSKDGRYTLTGLSGPDPAEISEGRGGWEEVPRNRRPPVTQWVGASARKTTVVMWLTKWREQGSIEPELATVDGLAPMAPTTDPPVVFVTGSPGVPSTIPWVVQTVTPTERLRLPDGRTSRVMLTFELLEHRPGDVVVVRPSAAKRSVVRNATPAPGKARTYTAKAGDTLSGVAAKKLGKASRWPEITNQDGSKIRNPNRLTAGQVLKLPA